MEIDVVEKEENFWTFPQMRANMIIEKECYDRRLVRILIDYKNNRSVCRLGRLFLWFMIIFA